jgi:hypothetical protein
MNPTQVDVHNVQLINSPKNFDFDLIHNLVDSNIEPQTNIDVNPYAVKIQKNILSISYFIFLKYM